jgi:glycosyltransferase involved in cell wall biosynthesis
LYWGNFFKDPSVEGLKQRQLSNDLLDMGMSVRTQPTDNRPEDGADKSPFISVITSTFCAEKHLLQAIASIRAQSFDDFEWIIIDGASPDGTLNIIQENQDVIDCWVSEPDTGIYDAWNKGVHLARGQWVLFLGADDQLLPASLETLAAAVRAVTYPIDFVASMVALYRGETPLRTIGRPWEWSEFRRYMSIAHAGGLHSMEYFQRYGFFDDSYRIAGDYEMLLRAGTSLRVLFVPVVTVHMQVGGVSAQNSRVFRETRRAKDTHAGRTAWINLADEIWAHTKWQIKRCIDSRWR